MKKLVLAIVLTVIVSGVFAQINVATNSNVGIGTTTPSQKLEVNGNLKINGATYSNSIYPNTSNLYLGESANRWLTIYGEYAVFRYNPTIDSDEDLKSDIKELDSVLDRIKLMKPVSYKFRGNGQKNDLYDKVVFGFLAQEVKPLFPETVELKEDGFLGIRYGDFVPVLLKAIQEQQKQIEELQEQVKELKQNSKN